MKLVDKRGPYKVTRIILLCLVQHPIVSKCPEHRTDLPQYTRKPVSDIFVCPQSTPCLFEHQEWSLYNVLAIPPSVDLFRWLPWTAVSWRA